MKEVYSIEILVLFFSGISGIMMYELNWFFKIIGLILLFVTSWFFVGRLKELTINEYKSAELKATLQEKK